MSLASAEPAMGSPILSKLLWLSNHLALLLLVILAYLIVWNSLQLLHLGGILVLILCWSLLSHFILLKDEPKLTSTKLLLLVVLYSTVISLPLALLLDSALFGLLSLMAVLVLLPSFIACIHWQRPPLDLRLPKEEESLSLFGLAERSRFWSLGEMAALITHDLSNPLHAVKYSGERLSQLISEERQEAVYVRQINTNLHRALELLAALRARMRSSSETSGFKSNFCDSHAYVMQIIKVSTAPADFNKIQVDVDPALAELSIGIPQVELIHILENLYRNSFMAMKSMPSGQIEVQLVEIGKERVKISLLDTGGGLSPGEFENLTRVNCAQPTNSRYKGLGLKLTYQMVEYYGGSLACLEPKRDSDGALFHLTLPLNS